MASIVWQSSGLPWDEVCRRAGARRKWNEHRQVLARQRRAQVLAAWRASGGRPGWQAQLARALGVHRSTICRDWQAIQAA